MVAQPHPLPRKGESPEVVELLRVMEGEMSRREIMDLLGLKDEKHFREHNQQRAIKAGVIELTIPDKPTCRLQKYRKRLINRLPEAKHDVAMARLWFRAGNGFGNSLRSIRSTSSFSPLACPLSLARCKRRTACTSRPALHRRRQVHRPRPIRAGTERSLFSGYGKNELPVSKRKSLLSSQTMEADRQNTLELFKILINSEDGKVAPGGDGADEEIGVGALNAFASRQAVKKGGLFEVFGGDWYIGESGKMVFELLKLPFGLDAGENLLPHRADDADACFADQLLELFKVRNLRARRKTA